MAQSTRNGEIGPQCRRHLEPPPPPPPLLCLPQPPRKKRGSRCRLMGGPTVALTLSSPSLLLSSFGALLWWLFLAVSNRNSKLGHRWEVSSPTTPTCDVSVVRVVSSYPLPTTTTRKYLLPNTASFQQQQQQQQQQRHKNTMPRLYMVHPMMMTPQQEHVAALLGPQFESFLSTSSSLLGMAVLHLQEESLSMTTSSSHVAAAVAMVSPEPIHTAFTIATFFPQPFWFLMIALPNHPFTKRIMGGLEVPLICSLIHFFIVVSSIVTGGSEATAPLAEFNDVFDPTGDPQQAFFHMTSTYPNFVAEEWSHVLTWDLFVGRYIWQDGLQRNVTTAPAVLLCNLIGPPGLLLHGCTCALSGQSILESNDKNSTGSGPS
jgi:Domain of unknown function (DUF4281)